VIPRTSDSVELNPHAVVDNPGRYVHVTPLGEVATLPLGPTTQNTEPFHVIARAVDVDVVPHVVDPNPDRYVHVMPSGEVATFPSSLEAQNTEPFHAIAIAKKPIVDVPHAVADRLG
jgi:hypothetical protein